MTRRQLPARGLYALTGAGTDDDKLMRDTELCVASGAAMLQYRDKLRTADDRLRIAERLRALCTRHQIPLIINDDVELAEACDADGVHLGRDELHALSRAKASRNGLVVGVSCYDSPQRARDAVAMGADYVAFGSVYGSATKPAAPCCGLDVLRVARAELAVPIVAIGGLTPENGRAALDAGADFLAVISGIFDCTDIAAAVQRYLRLFA